MLTVPHPNRSAACDGGDAASARMRENHFISAQDRGGFVEVSDFIEAKRSLWRKWDAVGM